MRIRNLLFVLILSVLVPAFVASALAVWYIYGEEQKAQEKGLIEAARTFALLVENEVQSQESILRTLAASPELVRGDLVAFYGHAKSMTPTPETNVVMLDQSDKQMLNTMRPLGAELLTKRHSDLLELAQKYSSTDLLISDLFYMPVAKRYGYALEIPVRFKGLPGYKLSIGVSAATLHKLTARQQFPKGWIGTIVDRNGVVVSRSRDAEKYTGKPVREYSRKILAASREGIYSSITLDGIPVKAYFSRVPNSDWSVLISIPEAEVRRVPVRAAVLLGSAMALVLALALVVARWLANRAIKPIERLRQSAQGLARGEEASYTPQGLMEIDAVGKQLADASSRIRNAKNELERKVAEAVTAAEHAQQALLQGQKLEALGRLTGGIAHEFNNLLQTLTSTLQLAGMLTSEERVRPLLDVCNKSVVRAITLTRQLSSFGRVQEATLSTVSPAVQIKSFQRLIENTLPSNIILEIDFPDSLWSVTVDPLQFELALLNIAINSRDAMPTGGKIVVRGRNESLPDPLHGLPVGDYVHIVIEDAGKGMPPAVLAKALDPFFTTKEVGIGSGLGLPQAYGFARQAKGTLVVKSVEGQGTTVEIFLPKAEHEALEASPMGAELARVNAKGRILFVEDDPFVRQSVGPALEQAGFTVLPAASADEALRMLEKDRLVDVVFSDIVMPGSMNGIELAKVVRARYPLIKVILATGYSDQQVVDADIKVFAKPYDVNEAARFLRDAISAN